MPLSNSLQKEGKFNLGQGAKKEVKKILLTELFFVSSLEKMELALLQQSAKRHLLLFSGARSNRTARVCWKPWDS